MSELALDFDRSSPVPLYFQVARQIEAAIERGDLPPGARLENEIQLADRLGLSRPTVRRAIQELVGKGLLVRKQGVGTQVLHGQVKRPVELTSLYDDLERNNQKPTTDVLLHTTDRVSDEIAIRLGLPVGAQALRLERIRYALGEPLALLHNWLPPSAGRLAEAELKRGGLYGCLRSAGVRICVATQRIGARSATRAEAGLLRVRPGAPLLTMERTSYDDTGRAVEYGRHVYRADSYSFETTLVERG